MPIQMPQPIKAEVSLFDARAMTYMPVQKKSIQPTPIFSIFLSSFSYIIAYFYNFVNRIMPVLLKNLLINSIFKLILAIFAIELLSLLSFKVALLSGIFFVIVVIVVLMFTLYKLEYGLLIALAELMIGSQGYLFYLDLPGFRVSMRLAIFLIVFFVWLFKYSRLHDSFNLLKRDRLAQTFLAFLAFIALGVINGLFHGNGFKNVFFDVNGYLYFGLFFVYLEVFKSKRQVDNFLKIFFAALTYVSLKIFFTLYLFSHSIPYLTDYFYHWIRDTRVGEITYAGANFFRIFFQSQIWGLIGVFVVVCLIIGNFAGNKPEVTGGDGGHGGNRSFAWLRMTGKRLRLLMERLGLGQGTFGMTKYLFGLLVFIETSILISFSRSFWLGGVVGMLALFVYLIFIARLNLKKFAQAVGLIFGSAALSLVLLFSIANFPLPKPSAEFSAQLLGGRLFSFYGEAGASSRWNQLPVLIEKIKESPLIGSGFGTTATYKSNDPRIKTEANPEGWYTTYTFEWGYLDTVTEIGSIGLLVYLVLIGQIMYSGWPRRKNFLVAGLLIGIIALLATNMFSPYLNHPLGIGYLLLCTAVFKVDI
jgi:hypothetical protein